ncbi:MAG: hypothetical protein IT430_01715 [Phycisphaerales bacterium]|nr:hypothetical protein [Phycisphaerales bacterium]
MARLIFFGVVIIVASLIWAGKQAAGAVSGSERLKQESFRSQTQKTMQSTARGVNWLNEQWEQAKLDAQRKTSASNLESSDFQAFASSEDETRCPRCGFVHGWNGAKCSHCGHT